MAKKVLELDTPFRVGEKVVLMSDLGTVGPGATGKVSLMNGISTWIRYWVRFADGQLVGQVSHDDLARPDQIDAWKRRREEAAAAASAPPQEAAPAAAADGGGGGGGGGAASGIPEAIIERSRAAKARKLGG